MKKISYLILVGVFLIISITNYSMDPSFFYPGREKIKLAKYESIKNDASLKNQLTKKDGILYDKKKYKNNIYVFNKIGYNSIGQYLGAVTSVLDIRGFKKQEIEEIIDSKLEKEIDILIEEELINNAETSSLFKKYKYFYDSEIQDVKFYKLQSSK
jgi:hypothetical protein